MAEQRHTFGRVVWRDMMSNDLARARAFYSELFGWKYETMNMGELGDYDIIKVGEKQIGGLFQRPSEGNTGTWMSYVSVPDVDRAAKIATENGGALHHGPQDIPNVGRFAVIADADEAIILPFRSQDRDPSPEMPKTHEFCWETLVTKDIAKAKDFYGKLFGWKSKPGPGNIPVFAVDDSMQGTIADIQEAKQLKPQWLTYVVVDKLEASVDRAKTLKAQVPVPITPIPEVGRISMIVDPLGARLGLFQPSMPM